MAHSGAAAVAATVPTSSSPRYPPQPPLTASSQHAFPSYDSLRFFLDSYAHARGFKLRFDIEGSAYSATHGGKATCWCSKPAAEQSSQQPVEEADSGVVSRKRRRASLTSDGVQVHCGCRWFVNFNRRGKGARSVYVLTARHLAHNGDQHTPHDERAVLTAPAAMDDASALQQRLFDAVEAGVKLVLSSSDEYASVAADERVIQRAVQLDKKRNGRFVCYAAKQCAAAISRQRQQQHKQQQQRSEHKDGDAMTDASHAPSAARAEEMADAMAAAIRARVALDEQLAGVAEVDSVDGFINLALHMAPTLPLATLTPPAPASSSIVSFPTFPQPASASSPASVSLPPSYLFPSIGTFHSIYNEKYGTPRQGSVAPHSRGRLVLHPHVDPQSLDGLSAYSHVWLLFVFHLNTNSAVRAKVRPPRLGAKVGVFATRSPHRPSPIGMTVARVERVELDRRTVHVSGVDVVDGTPVVDIKPYHPADCVPDAAVPQWVTDGRSESGGLDVRVQEHVRAEVRRWAVEGRLAMFEDGDEALAAVVECISGDPRTLNAKHKHRNTYGSATQHTEEKAQAERETDGGAKRKAGTEEVEEVEEEEEAAAAVPGGAAGDVIYGVSVDRLDVAFRMVYAEETVDAGESDEQDEADRGGKRRKKEVAEVFHCQLYGTGQARPKLRTKEWFEKMKAMLAQQRLDEKVERL